MSCSEFLKLCAGNFLCSLTASAWVPGGNRSNANVEVRVVIGKDLFLLISPWQRAFTMVDGKETQLITSEPPHR